MNSISRGMHGSVVTQVQNFLIKACYKITADGDFGPKTEAAVIDFQKKHGLTADGVVGPKTWAALSGNAPAPQPPPAPAPPKKGGPNSGWDPGTGLYVIQSGDTLSGLAQYFYQNAGRYMEIYNANHPPLQDPNKIYAGQKLVIPGFSPKGKKAGGARSGAGAGGDEEYVEDGESYELRFDEYGYPMGYAGDPDEDEEYEGDEGDEEEEYEEEEESEEEGEEDGEGEDEEYEEEEEESEDEADEEEADEESEESEEESSDEGDEGGGEEESYEEESGGDSDEGSYDE